MSEGEYLYYQGIGELAEEDADQRQERLTQQHLKEHPLLARSKWRLVRRYPHHSIRCIMVHENGEEVKGTAWSVDDGSAEAEAAHRLDLYMREYARRHGLPNPFADRDAAVAARIEESIRRRNAAIYSPRQWSPPVQQHVYTPPDIVQEPPSVLRDDPDAPSCCSCHLNPPCDFCITLTEEERDAYDAAGHVGLDRLWARWDEQQSSEMT